MKKLVKRSDKVAYYGIKQADGSVIYQKMLGFSELSASKNPKEYTRQYVTDDFETTDIVGFSPSISFAFDRFTENEVQADIVNIFDNEITGSEAVRSILMIDMTEPAISGFKCIKRSFTVVPDSEGNSTDAYTYSGNFKCKGKPVNGVAVIDGNTAKFTIEKTLSGDVISINDAVYSPTVFKLNGKTERETEPTYTEPCDIDTCNNPILTVGTLTIEIPLELCEGDYIEVDYENKKVTHVKTKTKWVATEDSLNKMHISGDEVFTSDCYNIDRVLEHCDFEVLIWEIKYGLSNVFGNFHYVSIDDSFYVSVNGDSNFKGMTLDEMKDYLIDKKAVVYLDLDEPVTMDITDTEYGQMLLSVALEYKESINITNTENADMSITYMAESEV